MNLITSPGCNLQGLMSRCVSLLVFFSAWAITTPSSGAVVSYQQGATTPFLGGTYTGSEDTMLARNTSNGDQTTRNFGGRNDFAVGGRSSDSFHRNSLLRFDVTSMLNQFSSIDSITLRLHFSVNSSTFTDQGDTIQVFQVSSANSDWIEGNLNGGPVPFSGESTWSHRHVSGAPVSWAGSEGASTAGTDYVNSLLAGTAFNRTELAGQVFDLVFADTSFFSNWVAGTNPGLYLKGQTATNAAQVIFHSSEASTLALRPELIVSFTPIPEPSVLMFVCGSVVGLVLHLKRRLS